MGILDKLHFKKKDDDFLDLDNNMDIKTKSGSPGPAFENPPGLEQPPQQQAQPAPTYGAPQPSPGVDLGLPGMPSQSEPQQKPASQAISTYAQHETQELVEKSLEVINSKIDALRVEMNQINQRLANIETILRPQPQQQQSNEGWRY